MEQDIFVKLDALIKELRSMYELADTLRLRIHEAEQEAALLRHGRQLVGEPKCVYTRWYQHPGHESIMSGIFECYQTPMNEVGTVESWTHYGDDETENETWVGKDINGVRWMIERHTLNDGAVR